jgi:hypothetical protein
MIAHAVGLGQRLIGHHGAKRVQSRIERLDPGQEQLHQLAGRRLSRTDPLRQSSGAGEGQVGVH